MEAEVAGRGRARQKAEILDDGRTLLPCLGCSTVDLGAGGWDVVEADEVDVFAVAVFGDFEQVDEAEEAGGAGELRGDVGEADEVDGVDFDFAFFHAVPVADDHMGARPDADAAGDFAAADALAEAFGEGHGESLARCGRMAQAKGHDGDSGLQGRSPE